MAVQLPPNSTGSVIDTLLPTASKERQIVIVGDPVTGANVQNVTAGGNAQVFVPDTTSSSTALGAGNAAVSVSLAGLHGAGVLITAGGTLVGTLIPEISYDGGTTWVASYFFNASQSPQLNVPAGGLAQTITVASPGAALLSILVGPGASNARMRVSSYTSGSSNATMRASQAGAVTSLVFNSPLDGGRATYASSALALAIVTGATDVFTLAGATGKVIRVLRVGVSLSIATAAQYVDVNLVKRSTADTAGASTNPAIAGYDSNNLAAGAVVTAYTANPTLGTPVGLVAAQRIFAPLTGTPALGTPPCVFDFGNRPGQAVILRGAGQLLCVNLNAPSNAGTGDLFVEWTEE